MTKLLVSHVYSRSNLGDGLLADLTLALLREVTDVAPLVIAIDPSGFPDTATSVYGGRPRSMLGAAGVVGGLFHVKPDEVCELFRGSRLVVATGGAYLRAATPRESVTFSATHLTQLLLATERARRAVYLPQSIFPLCRPLSGIVRRRLARADRVYVRDDRSADELGLPNAERMPDLAVLEIARVRSRARLQPAPAGQRILVQLRDLNRPGWLDVASRFLSSLPDFDLIVQSDAGRSNDDQQFAARLGIAKAERLDSALARAGHPFGIAICGRLHAALVCIMHGVPALHLAYERKSFGAYSDLGLSDYLLMPADLGNGRALRIAAHVLEHPSEYWSRLDARNDHLLRSRQCMVNQLSISVSAAGLLG